MLLLAALGACGDPGGGQGDENDTDSDPTGDSEITPRHFVTEDQLLGAWTRQDGDGAQYVRTFNADGTCEDDDHLFFWQLDGYRLTIEVVVGGAAEMTEAELSALPYEKLVETIAIVYGVLYEGATLRTDGTGTGLDGTWVWAEQEWEGGTYGAKEAGAMYNEERAETVVAGNTFERKETESGDDDEEGQSVEHTSEESFTGTVAQEGNVVRFTPDVEDEGEIERMRVSEDVLVRTDPYAVNEIRPGYMWVRAD